MALATMAGTRSAYVLLAVLMAVPVAAMSWVTKQAQAA